MITEENTRCSAHSGLLARMLSMEASEQERNHKLDQIANRQWYVLIMLAGIFGEGILRLVLK